MWNQLRFFKRHVCPVCSAILFNYCPLWYFIKLKENLNLILFSANEHWFKNGKNVIWRDIRNFYRKIKSLLGKRLWRRCLNKLSFMLCWNSAPKNFYWKNIRLKCEKNTTGPIKGQICRISWYFLNSFKKLIIKMKFLPPFWLQHARVSFFSRRQWLSFIPCWQVNIHQINQIVNLMLKRCINKQRRRKNKKLMSFI